LSNKKKSDVKTLGDLTEFILEILDEFEVLHHEWSEVFIEELIRGKKTKPVRLRKVKS